MPGAKLTISDVHQRTSIPVTTLRFYEKELPTFFSVTKTAGGHRRYTEESVQQFLLVKRMTESEGIRLSDIREKFIPKPSQDTETRKHVDLLLSVYEAMTGEIERLRKRVDSLERALTAARNAEEPANKKKRWFS